MLISQKIDSLLQGVSQRPERLRRSDHVAEQVNMISTEKGLMRRPPTKDVTKVTSGGPFSHAFTHHIVVSDSEKYLVVVGNSTIKVFDLETGSEHPVTMLGSASTYMANANANFRALTIDDKTILVNRDATVEKLITNVSPDVVYEAMVYIRQVDYSTTYKVTLDGFTFSYTTPDANSPHDRAALSTTEITKSIIDEFNLLSAVTSYFSVFRCTPYGDAVLHFTKTDNTDFNISVADGLGDKGMLLIKDTVQKFTDLPEKSRTGFTVEITGDPNTQFDNSYVKFDGSTWVEVVKPATLISLDPSTMPHVLSRVGTYASNLVVSGMPSVVSRIFKDDLVKDHGQGFDKDKNGNTVAATDDQILDGDDDYYQATMTSAFLATVNYSVDTSSMDPGTSVYVDFQLNGVLQGKSPNYVAGGIWTAEQKTFDVTAGDVVTVLLRYNHNITPQNVYRRARVVLGGTNNESIPGISRTHYTKTTIQFDYFSNNISAFPLYVAGQSGASVQVTVNGTLIVDQHLTISSSANIALSVYNALLSAQPTWNVSVTADHQVSIGIPHGVDSVGSTAYVAPDSVTVDVAFDNTTRAWFPASPVSGSLVGLTVKNLTDGSQATITVSAQTSVLNTTTLSGGARNTYAPGDILEIEGTSFTLGPAVWDDRDCGDLITSPWPTFVDKEIKDLFYEQNRLGLMLTNGVVMSCISKPFRFFRQTASALLPTDVIDVTYAASAQRVAFHSAKSFNSYVYLTHDLGQVKLYGDPVLTPTTVRMDPVSWYPNTSLVPPYADGNSLFFIRNQTQGIQLFEYIDPEQSPPVAEEVSKDIPNYITGNPVAFTGDAALGFIAISTDLNRNTIYVYQHKRENGEYVINAWHKWTLQADMQVLALENVDGVLAIVASNTDSVYVMYLDVSSAVEEGSINGKAKYLDWFIENPTGSFSGGLTTYTIPYAVATNGSQGTLVVMDTSVSPPVVLAYTRLNSTQVRVTGDTTAKTVVIGVSYLSYVDLGTIFLRDDQGKPETRGRTQLRSINVEYADTSDLTVTLDATGKTQVVSTLNTAVQDGSFTVPILTRNTEASIRLSTSTAGSFTITGIDWEGYYQERSKRV